MNWIDCPFNDDFSAFGQVLILIPTTRLLSVDFFFCLYFMNLRMMQMKFQHQNRLMSPMSSLLGSFSSSSSPFHFSVSSIEVCLVTLHGGNRFRDRLISKIFACPSLHLHYAVLGRDSFFFLIFYLVSFFEMTIDQLQFL